MSSSLIQRTWRGHHPTIPGIIATDVLPDSDPQKPSKTITWNELPAWQRDNEYIITGYRRWAFFLFFFSKDGRAWNGCIASIFGYLHNETVNIHTHLWGAVLFVYLMATMKSTYFQAYNSTTWKDTTVCLIFQASAVFCLLASALYHTSGCHSQKVASSCHAYDYSGIIVLTVGSFYPCIYYGFFCHPQLQWSYLVLTTLFGLVAAYFVLSPEYAKPTHRGARTSVFIGLGLTGLLPILHLLLTQGWNELSNLGVPWLLMSASFYIGGALLYANRIPERSSPGRFDYFFASHQIFHVCVVLAALSHHKMVMIGMHYRHSQSFAC